MNWWRRIVTGVSARTGFFAAGLLVLLALFGWNGGRVGDGLDWKGPKSVAPVAEQLVEAVVNISTTQAAKGPQGVPLPNVPPGAPFEEFFEDFFEGNGRGIRRKVSSLGSGFVIDGAEGLIVTNNHVVADADEIIINFHDGRKLKVDKVIGRDVKTDIAVLKVTPEKPLKDVKFGTSATLRVGDWVMAIGNPFGLGGSVTVGIISAKQRDIQSGPYDDYLQTDAAINKGNSGGPLFNMSGEVIGINTAIISPSGGSIGIGFSVPSDTAVNVIDQLRKFGETRRGWFGVNVQSVTDEIAKSLAMKDAKGALVSSVAPKSPAEKAGVKAGDVIVSFDGQDIKTMRNLPRIVAQTEVGRKVSVRLLRDEGNQLSVQVEVGRLPEEQIARNDATAPKKPKTKDAPSAPDEPVLGLLLKALTAELRQAHKLDRSVNGVVVTEVEKGSAAERKGVKVGDVVVEAGKDVVSTVAGFAKSVAKVRKSGRRAVLLRVEDARGSLRFVAVPFE